MVRRATVTALVTPLLLGGGLVLGLHVLPGCDRNESSARPSRPKTLATSDPVPDGAQTVAIEATAKGFVPAEVHVTQGRPAVLTFTRVVESSCVDAVKMPWRDEPYDLPLDKPVNIIIPDTSKAGDFAYACWMDMVRGRVVIDAAPAP